MNPLIMPTWLNTGYQEAPSTPRSRRAQQATHICIPGAGLWTEGVKYYVCGNLGKGGSSTVFKANLHSNGIDTPCALVVDTAPSGILSPNRRGQTLKQVVRAHLVGIQILWNRLLAVKPHLPILHGISAIKLDKSPIPSARAAIALEILKPLAGNPVRLAQKITAIQELLKNEGILHRDIKPENLMMRDDGTVVLIDWNECLFIDDVKEMNEREFNQLLDRLATTEEYAQDGYGEHYGMLKKSSDKLEIRKVSLIALEKEHEESSFSNTIRQIFSP